jgi:hypothetical protein
MEILPIVCDLKAIEVGQRPRYENLVKRLRAAVQKRSNRDDGYAYKLDSTGITLPEVAEWMSMERLCCPFLTLQLSAAGNQEGWLLTLTGPEGVKPLLESEFPAR